MYEGDYNARIDTKLKRIHDEIISKYNLSEKAKKDNIAALQIQGVLRILKGLEVEPDVRNPVEVALFEQAYEQASLLESMATAQLNANRGTPGRGTLSGLIFRRQHGVKSKKTGKVSGVLTSWGGDDIFEEELAAVIAAIESEALGVQTSLSSKLTGSKTGNVQLEREMGKDVQKVMSGFISNTEKRLNKEAGKSTKHYTGPVARAIKTDVRGTSQITVDSALNENWNLLFQLFKGKTFTVKNYSSYHKDRLDIHLGDSDYFKAIYGILSDLGYSQDYIEKVIFSGFNSIKRNSSGTKVHEHFYHMRFIYELQGVGLYDSEGIPISGTDFLIYNDPGSKNIYVRSTAQMILDELELAKKSALGGINIKKSYFSS